MSVWLTKLAGLDVILPNMWVVVAGSIGPGYVYALNPTCRSRVSSSDQKQIDATDAASIVQKSASQTALFSDWIGTASTCWIPVTGKNLPF